MFNAGDPEGDTGDAAALLGHRLEGLVDFLAGAGLQRARRYVLGVHTQARFRSTSCRRLADRTCCKRG